MAFDFPAPRLGARRTDPCEDLVKRGHLTLFQKL